MPFKPHDINDGGGQVPNKPHLGIPMGGGEVMAVPIGAGFLIIEDPTNRSKILPMILTKVSRQKLSFKCACGRAECTRVFEYNLDVTKLGHHFNEEDRQKAIAKRRTGSMQ